MELEIIGSNLQHFIFQEAEASPVEIIIPQIKKIIIEPGFTGIAYLKYLGVDTLILNDHSVDLFLVSPIVYLQLKGSSGNAKSIKFLPFSVVGFIDAREDSSSSLTINFVETHGTISKLESAQNTVLIGYQGQGPRLQEFDSIICHKSLSIRYFEPDFLNSGYPYLTANYISVGGDGLYSSFTCRHMQLNAGTSHTFTDFFTQKIDSLSAIGLPGQEIHMQNATAGIVDTIHMIKNFCSDYLVLRDIWIDGGANYYAGANSVNVSNNSGWNFSACFTGIDDPSLNLNQGIYPVPSHNIIYFKEPADKIKVLDITGKLIMSLDKNYTHSLDVTELQFGIYLIEIINDNGVFMNKFLKN